MGQFFGHFPRTQASAAALPGHRIPNRQRRLVGPIYADAGSTGPVKPATRRQAAIRDELARMFVRIFEQLVTNVVPAEIAW